MRKAARQFVADAEPSEVDSILGLIGVGHSGRTDVSERHDDYLVEDPLDEPRR